MKNLVAALLLIASATSFAATTSYRNTVGNNHYLGGYALHVIYTNPIQANQPVYAWRTHTNFDNTPGIHSQNGTLIGYTDNQGVLTIVMPRLPSEPVHCGWINSERVAVGSRNARKSNALNFTIRAPRIGPLPPWFNQCQPSYR